MAFFHRHKSPSYAPSAPSLQPGEKPYTSASPNYYAQQSHSRPAHPHGTPPPNANYGHATSSYGYGYSSDFPPGTNPDVIRSFQMVDRDRSGFIDENELQQALTATYHRFCLRTIRLLMFLFKNPNDPLRIGQFLFFSFILL